MERNETKHTPGPWSLHYDPPHKYSTWDDAGGYRVDAEGVEQLAYVWNKTTRATVDGQDGPEFGSNSGEADARLIAAAPTLLDALIEARDLLELICMIDPSADPHEGSVGQKVRDAIALATSANLKEPQSP
jgi:hypothetical protein